MAYYSHLLGNNNSEVIYIYIHLVVVVGLQMLITMMSVVDRKHSPIKTSAPPSSIVVILMICSKLQERQENNEITSAPGRGRQQK